MLANIARGITAAVTAGIEKPAAALLATVSLAAAQAAAAPIAGLPSSVAKLGASAGNAAACVADLSQVSLGGAANFGAATAARTGMAAAKVTNTEGFFMGQPVGGGGGMQAMHDGAANSANMSAALAAQRAASAANS